MIDLEDLRRKAEAAAPGEWRLHLVDDTCVCSEGVDIATTCDSSNAERDDAYNVDYERMERDAAFIVAAQPRTILALIAEIDRCHARLEIDHVYRVADGETVREDIAYADRGNVPDGITCRDATIDLIEERIAELVAKLKSPR